MKKSLLSLFLFLIGIFLVNQSVHATHFIGDDIAYKCATTAGHYTVTIKLYRDCQGIQLCPGCPGSIAGCTIGSGGETSIKGLDPICSGTSFGGFVLPVLPNVSGFDVVQLCAGGKSICTNCGSRSPGTFSPGIEIYTFEGDVDLSALPSSCCKVSISYSSCCRSGAITTLLNPNGDNFYTEAIIDRCQAPCNNSPVYTNEPIIAACAGQDIVYNLGAIDPDGDSLSYALGPCLLGQGSPATYVSPYGPGVPFPFLGVPNTGLPLPAGLHIDPVSGDVKFRPQGIFVSDLVIEVTQWKKVSGVYVKVGVTRRDLQLYTTLCGSNSSPVVYTWPKGVRSSNYSFNVCPGQQLCFDVEAYDTLPGSDTASLSWSINSEILQNGGTLTSIPAGQRPNGKGQNDMAHFCWTPAPSMMRSLPYYLGIRAKDKFCSIPGSSAYSIAIYVNKPGPPAIAGLQSVRQNDTFSYSVPYHPGSSFQWTVSGGTIISGGSTDSITVQWTGLPSGRIVVKETNIAGCQGDSTLLNISINTTAGTNEINAFKNLKVYPNPTSSLLNISFDDANGNDLRISLTDALGREIMLDDLQKIKGAFNKNYDLTTFAKGIYIVKIMKQAKQQSLQIILQ